MKCQTFLARNACPTCAFELHIPYVKIHSKKSSNSLLRKEQSFFLSPKLDIIFIYISLVARTKGTFVPYAICFWLWLNRIS